MRYSYKTALSALTEYCYSEGFLEVTFDFKDVSTLYSHHHSPIYIPRRIKIEGRYNYEMKTYLMLHELGHHEMRKSWKRFEKRFPIVALAENHAHKKYERKLRRRQNYFVECLEEEIAAWDEGLKLARKFDIVINMDRFINIRTKCLIQYMNYYGTLKK
jgi:hypothetical protein